MPRRTKNCSIPPILPCPTKSCEWWLSNSAQMTMALIAQAAIHQLRLFLGGPAASRDAEHFARTGSGLPNHGTCRSRAGRKAPYFHHRGGRDRAGGPRRPPSSKSAENRGRPHPCEKRGFFFPFLGYDNPSPLGRVTRLPCQNNRILLLPTAAPAMPAASTGAC